MVTDTKSPDDLSPGTNPGQDEFDKLNEHFSGSSKAAGKHSDPRGDDSSMPSNQNVAAGDPSDPRGTPSKDDLAASEKAATPQYEDQVGSGYKEAGKSKVSFLSNNRKRLIGGGVAGGVIGLVVFLSSFFAGPLEFIHFGELLKQFHFTNNQNFSDARSMRNILYTINHQGNKTRLGRITNKFADKWEEQLVKQVGLKPVYTSVTNRFAGFEVVDEELASNQLSEFEGDGIDTHGSTSSLVDSDGKAVDSSSRVVRLTDEQFRTRRSIIRGVGQATDTSKIISSIASRLLIKRGGVDFHPLKNIVRSKLDSLTTYDNKVRDEAGQDDKLGVQDDTFKSTVREDTNGTTDTQAQPVADESNTIIGQAEAAGAEGVEGQATLEATENSFITKATAGPAVVVGVLCSLRAFGSTIPNYQYLNIVLPEMRLGFRVVSTASQIQSGQDVNGDELGALAQSFNNPTDKTSWTDARSIQAELGQPQSGPDIPSSAKPSNVGNEPEFFNILSSIPFLGTACYVSGGFLSDIPGVGSILKFTSGEIVSGIDAGISSVAGSKYTIPNLLADAIKVAAGEGANVFSQGAEFGNLANYGARLAANDQAISEGGRALTTQESTQLSIADQQESQAEFQSHNIAYKLFDPYDYRSAISKVIDQMSTSPTQNITKMASAMVHLPRTLGSLPSLFESAAHAATPSSYDYGFPEYGFSQDEQSNPEFDNPYDNADVVENQLGLANLNAKYGACFSMTVDPTTGSLVNGTAVNYTTINPQKHPECSDGSDALLRYRFYIADTVTAKSLACYEGDEESCTELGFDTTSSTTPTPSTGSGGADCNDLTVNVDGSKNGGTVNWSSSVGGTNSCGQTITQCDLFDSGGSNLAEMDSGSGTISGYPSAVSISCQTEGYPTNSNAIGYKDI